MAQKISRPAYDSSEASVQRLQRSYGRALKEIEWLEESPEMFGLTFSKTLNTAFVHCLHDPAANTIGSWEAWVAAMQTGSALFASASAPEGTTVECLIAHKVRTIPASGTRHFVHAANWLEAFWLAVICRDQARMTRLCNIPIEQLRASGAQFEEYIYHWVDALQTYWLERPGLGEKLVTAFDGTSPDTIQSVDRELMLKILYPPLNLFYRFISQDPEKFNEALVEAIELHKEYWTADEERSEDLSGAVALAPLAIACLAYDAGRPIDVESEYLPANLLDRSWLGEFEI